MTAKTDMKENSFFDFEKEKVQTLGLNQLELTHKENDVYGNPLRGVYHYQLINEMMLLAKQQNMDFEVYDLFAAQNKDRNQPGVVILPQVEQIYGERAVEAHILRRVFANIRIKNLDNDEMTTNLAVAFHQKGIQVGFGNMVKVCHNQCMLGAMQYASTYGEDKYNLESLLDVVKSWLVDYRRIILDEREKIEKMKQIDVPAERLHMIIGMLTAMRVAKDSSNSEIHVNETYPLNQSQISQFTESLLITYKREEKVSLWDVYQSATDLYKANTMDIPQMLPQNLALTRFVNEMYF